MFGVPEQADRTRLAPALTNKQTWSFPLGGRALDPDLIRSFLAAVEVKNFTRAGDRLSLTQQAVSGQMRRLESIVGRQLFVRAGTSIHLTADAEVLAAYMRQTQAIAERVDAHFASIPLEGSVHIGIIEGFASAGLPAILAAVHQRRPRIKVVVEVASSDQLMIRMQNKGLDILLGSQRAGGENGVILWSDKLRWVGDLDSYADPAVPIPLATRPEPSMVRSIAIEALTKVGRKFEVVFESDSLSSLRAAFGAGIGIGVITDMFRGSENSPHVDTTFLPDLGELEYFLLVQRDDDPLVQAFATLFKEVAYTNLQRISKLAIG